MSEEGFNSSIIDFFKYSIESKNVLKKVFFYHKKKIKYGLYFLSSGFISLGTSLGLLKLGIVTDNELIILSSAFPLYFIIVFSVISINYFEKFTMDFFSTLGIFYYHSKLYANVDYIKNNKNLKNISSFQNNLNYFHKSYSYGLLKYFKIYRNRIRIYETMANGCMRSIDKILMFVSIGIEKDFNCMLDDFKIYLSETKTLILIPIIENKILLNDIVEFYKKWDYCYMTKYGYEYEETTKQYESHIKKMIRRYQQKREILMKFIEILFPVVVSIIGIILMFLVPSMAEYIRMLIGTK